MDPANSPVCQNNVDTFVHSFAEWGIALHPDKMEGPSTCLTVLGFELDTIALQLTSLIALITALLESYPNSLIAAHHLFAFTASHEAGRYNSIADVLSHFDFQHFHRLAPHVAPQEKPKSLATCQWSVAYTFDNSFPDPLTNCHELQCFLQGNEGHQCSGARFSKVPKSFCTRKAVAKSQTL